MSHCVGPWRLGLLGALSACAPVLVSRLTACLIAWALNGFASCTSPLSQSSSLRAVLPYFLSLGLGDARLLPRIILAMCLIFTSKLAGVLSSSCRLRVALQMGPSARHLPCQVSRGSSSNFMAALHRPMHTLLNSICRPGVPFLREASSGHAHSGLDGPALVHAALPQPHAGTGSTSSTCGSRVLWAVRHYQACRQGDAGSSVLACDTVCCQAGYIPHVLPCTEP